MLFKINTDSYGAEAVPASSFSDLPYHERYDIQEWVLDNPELLGEPLLVITTEFSGFDKTSERLDVLALDMEGRLAVIELKRTALGTIADLQALRYAAYCSTLTLSDVAELRADYRSKRGEKTTPEEAVDEIRNFVDLVELKELDDKPRIILAADAFGDEITATALWLRSFEIDMRCVRLTPYTVDGSLVVDSSVLIPVPEAEQFMIRREKKEASRSSSGPAPKPTLAEFLARIPEPVRRFVEELREEVANQPWVQENVHNGLIAYRRVSDNAWVSLIQHTQKQARFRAPVGDAVPEEMIFAADEDGWCTIAVTNDEELVKARAALRNWVLQMAEGTHGS